MGKRTRAGGAASVFVGWDHAREASAGPPRARLRRPKLAGLLVRLSQNGGCHAHRFWVGMVIWGKTCARRAVGMAPKTHHVAIDGVLPLSRTYPRFYASSPRATVTALPPRNARSGVTRTLITPPRG